MSEGRQAGADLLRGFPHPEAGEATVLQTRGTVSHGPEQERWGRGAFLWLRRTFAPGGLPGGRAGCGLVVSLLFLLASAPLWALDGILIGYYSVSGEFVTAEPIPPYKTDLFAAYLVDFRIDGAVAQPGDMIAFFDPQGVLCGFKAVTASDDASTLLVTVYGDDPSTATDEGASEGDILTAKLLQPSTQRLFQSASVVLKPGTGQYESFPPSPVPPVWHDQETLSLKVDTATHFPPPLPNSNSYAMYAGHLTIRGATADIGDEVAIYDPQGVLCGHFRVDTPGDYGFLYVYGDDPDTAEVDEGAISGDVLTFRVWDRSAGIEYAGSDIVFTAGAPVGGYGLSPLPPLWSDGSVYLLDLAVAASAALAGDINHDATVDLADAILALRILSGQPPALPSLPKAADISGDGRIGLPEVLFILQKVAGLR